MSKFPPRTFRSPGSATVRAATGKSVHPGNKEFVEGDKIPRPEGGGGGRGGRESGSGQAVDDFVFTLSRDEFLSIFFEDLELPNLMRTAMAEAEQKKLIRAGYVKEGTPCSLSVGKTMKTALARRIALGGPIKTEIADSHAKSWRLPPFRAAAALASRRCASASVELEARLDRLPFLDDVDLRYRHRVAVPAPTARAVMFCLMDVSASMDERKKDLAKRFFTLLYLFLTRKYERVELVFIRHTDEAQEVDEDTFFYDTQSGGTVVFSALEMMQTDLPRALSEVGVEHLRRASLRRRCVRRRSGQERAFLARASAAAQPLLRLYRSAGRQLAGQQQPVGRLRASARPPGNFAMRRVVPPQEIYPVFRELFRKEIGCHA